MFYLQSEFVNNFWALNNALINLNQMTNFHQAKYIEMFCIYRIKLIKVILGKKYYTIILYIY
jgi:hypothetical protein